METATLYKLVLLVIAGATFYGWDNKKRKDTYRTVLWSCVGLMTVLGVNEFGWMGAISPIACLGVALFLLWGSGDGMLILKEMFGERKGLEEDFYAKHDPNGDEGETVLLWPMTKAATDMMKEVAKVGKQTGQKLRTKRGGYNMPVAAFFELVEGAIRQKGLTVADHPSVKKAKNKAGMGVSVSEDDTQETEAPFPIDRRSDLAEADAARRHDSH